MVWMKPDSGRETEMDSPKLFFDCVHCAGSVYQGIDKSGAWIHRGVVCMKHGVDVVCGDCPDYESEEEQ